MELINGLIKNNQKIQSAEEIIPTLCDRIINSRLASDKRAAILTMKGFSREYRELVIANSLRGLILTLCDFTEDTNLLKATLETLLILYIRGEGDDDLTRGFISQQSRTQNGKYPSPLLNKTSSIDQFSLWIADEVTKDERNIQTLVSLLENTDFYVRLYTLQFLEALVSTRPVKVKESILNTPLGIPKLVEVLGDVHDPVRNEAVLLLMSIANDNFNIQKLVAFENTFDKLFEIIHEEGDIRGSIVVQDCLTLISNLLKYNVSNQKLFLETNCLSKLAFLISEPISKETIIWNDQRLQNISMALYIVRLFVLEGNESTPANQDALFKADIFLFILRLSFSTDTPNSVRPTALLTVADLIAKNPEIQLKFSSIDVPYIDPSLPVQLQNFKGTIPVVIALLNWCLFINSVHVFDIRAAASHLLEAYFHDNDEARIGFIQDQIAEFKGEEEIEKQQEEVIEPVVSTAEVNSDGEPIESVVPQPLPSKVLKKPPRANIFAALLEYDPEIKLNPYKIWFSSIILIDVIHSNDEIKHIVTSLTSGDEQSGEEVISAIQAISGLLLTTLNTQYRRISIGYLLLLIVWLYEDFEAVNDFLGDLSTVKSLLTYLSQASLKDSIIQGLVTILLGVAFEFSSKDSKIPRVELHFLIVKMLGKDNYSFKILQLKESPAFADFNEDEIFDPNRDETGLPEVFFHPIVVQLIKENFYRIKNALNQDPSLESTGRISYEKFEQLHSTYNDLRISYEKFKEKSSVSQQEVQNLLDSALNDLSDISDKYDAAAKELEELKIIHNELDSKFKATVKELENLKLLHHTLNQSSSQHQRDLQSRSQEIVSQDKQITELKRELDQVKADKKKAEDGINKMSRELFQLTKAKEELERNIKKLERDIQNNVKQQQKLEQSLKQKTEESQLLKTKLDSITKELKNINDEKNDVIRHFDELKVKDQQNTGFVEQMTEKLRSIATTCNELTNDKSQLESQIASLHESHSKEVSSLKSKIQELELSNKDLSELTDSLAAEKESLSKSLESTKSEGQSTFIKLQDSLDKLQIELQNVRGELETFKQLAVKYEDQSKELNGSLKLQKAELESLKESHAKELEAHQSDHDSKLGEVQKQLSTERKSQANEIAFLTAKLDELTKLKEVISKELDENREKSTNLAKDLSEREKLIRESDSKLVVLESEITRLKDSEKALNDQISQRESEHCAKVTELKATVKELEQKIKAQVDEIDGNAAEFEEKEAESKEAIASLKDRLSSLEGEKKSLEASLEVASQSIEAKGKDYEDIVEDLKLKSAEVQELKSSLKEVKSTENSIRISLKTAKDDITIITKERDQLKKKVDTANYDASKRESNIQSLNKKIKEQKEKFTVAQNELENQIKELDASIEAKSEAFEKERSLLSQNSDASTQEYSEKVTKLEEEMAKLEKKHSVRVRVLEKQKLELEEKIEELTTVNKKLNDDIDTKIHDAVSSEARASEFEKELTRLKIDYEKVKKEADNLFGIQSDLFKIKNDSESLKKEITAKESAIKEANTKFQTQASELEKTKKELTSSKADIEELNNKSESSSAELNAKVKNLEKSVKILESEKTELSKKLEDSIKLSKESVETTKKELASKEDELKIVNKTLNDLQIQLTALKSKSSELERAKEENVQAYTEKLKELESENIKLKKSSVESVEKLESDTQSLKDENAKLLTQLEKLKSELLTTTKGNDECEKVKNELDKLKQTTVPKSELDDLMLVLGDLDEKKSNYKQSVKDLGGDVSSEEDDEEDEEIGEE